MDRARESEQYQAIAATASEVSIAIDERSVIQSANPAVEGSFGYRSDESVGDPLTAVLPERPTGRHDGSSRRDLDTGERHDGDVWVESDPGEGATFALTLCGDGDG